MKAHGGCVCKGPHIHSNGARKLDSLYPRGKPPVLILQEAEWTPGPVLTGSEEKSSPPRHPGSYPGHRAHSQAPCHLSYLVHRIFGCIPEGCALQPLCNWCFSVNLTDLILWFMNMMNNGQMDHGTENPTQHLPRKITKKPQSGWSAPGFEPGTSRMRVSSVTTEPPRSVYLTSIVLL